MFRYKKCLIYVIFILLIFSGFSFAATEEATVITPDEALEKLKDGNKRFTSKKRSYPNLSLKRLQKTVEDGQHPFATIIGCSDSRAPIEHIFDAGVGDIFVIRVAGNVSDVDEAGSIEYGVDHLGTPVFVVMGHSSCGAVTAVSKGAEVHGNIPILVDNILPAVKKVRKKLGKEINEKFLAEAVKENVWQSIDDLFRLSHVTLQRVKDNKLKVVGAVYHLDSGEVEWLGQHPAQEKLLFKYGSAIHTTLNGLSTKHFITRILFVTVVVTIIFILTYIIFFNDSKGKKKKKVKYKILGGYFSLIITFLIYLLFLPFVVKKINFNFTIIEFLILLLSIFTISSIFVFIFTGSIVNSFRRVINILKNEIK